MKELQYASLIIPIIYFISTDKRWEGYVNATRTSPARDRAINHLHSLIRAGSSIGNYFLPSLNTLASDAGVSRMTMWHAVRALEAKGYLRSVSSHGITITATPPLPHSDQPLPGRNEHTIEARIGRAIAEGTYRADTPFPRVKELCAMHKAGYRRMHAALEHLANDGLLVHRDHHFDVAEATPAIAHSTLVFIAASDNMSILADATPRSIEFWRVLEQETAMRGISITTMSFESAINRFLKQKHRRPGKSSLNNRPVLGFICWNLSLNSDAIIQLCAMATSTERPLAIFDEWGTIQTPSSVMENRLCRIYPIYGTLRCGTIMGAYLLGSGYRRVAYVTPDRATGLPRKHGIMTVFEAAGLPKAITPFSPLSVDNSGRRETDVPEASRMVIGLLKQHGIPADDSDSGRLGSEYLDRFVQRIRMRGKLTPVFDRILDESKYDCIVGYNDIVALLALEHLHKRGVSVPRTMGVAGFDDTITAIGQGLTSYNWNTPGTVRSMLQFITRPAEHNRLFRREGSVVEVDGMVMQRGTTRTG